MKIIKSVVAAAVLAVTASASVAAPIYTVDYTVNYTSSPGVWGTGSFTGEDTNGNGFLSLNELTAFEGSDNSENQYVVLAGLSGFGTFDIAANTWLANGTGWGQSNFAYFSWNGDGNSVNNTWATVSTTLTSTGGDVPEPASMALLGLGLVGLATMRRMKA